MIPRPVDLKNAAVLRRHGAVVNPLWTAMAAREAGIGLPLAVALLHQESGGGHNVWGHDPTIFVGGYDAKHGRHYGPDVIRLAYAEYKRQRGPYGRGGMQGVGPCQLTYFAFQDEADSLGGCYKPLPNMRVGFGYLARNIRRYGKFAGIKAYNGSGPAADRYAESVITAEALWKKRLGL